MKATTLQNRIAKSNNKNGSTPKNPAYYLAVDVVTYGKCRPANSGFSGGRAKVSDHSLKVISYLKDWGIDFEKGNDAPRGGKSGDFIKLTAKGKMQCKDFSKIKELERNLEMEGYILRKRKALEERHNAEIALNNEANSIILDTEFCDKINTIVPSMFGIEKSNYCASLLKGLLERNKIGRLENDFWAIFRLLKSKAEQNK